MYGKDVGDKYVKFTKHIIKCGFKKLSHGAFRTTFIRNNMVIKVPINTDGEVDNMVENAAYHKYWNGPIRGYKELRLAPCRLLPNGCLMMMALESINDDENMPDWCRNVDGGQCGLHRGRWVAYDYALELVKFRQKLEKKLGTKSQFFHEEILWEDPKGS